jgi:hypothetical protein
MILCNRICQVPPLLTESQQTIWCPDCDECNCGTCSRLTPTSGDPSRHIVASSLLADGRGRCMHQVPAARVGSSAVSASFRSVSIVSPLASRTSSVAHRSSCSMMETASGSSLRAARSSRSAA